MLENLRQNVFIKKLDDKENRTTGLLRYFKSLVKYNAYYEYNLEHPYNLLAAVYIGRDKKTSNEVKQIRKQTKIPVSRTRHYEDYATSEFYTQRADGRSSWSCGTSFNKLDIIIDNFFNLDDNIQRAIRLACCVPNVYVKDELNIYVYSYYDDTHNIDKYFPSYTIL